MAIGLIAETGIEADKPFASMSAGEGAFKPYAERHVDADPACSRAPSSSPASACAAVVSSFGPVSPRLSLPIFGGSKVVKDCIRVFPDGIGISPRVQFLKRVIDQETSFPIEGPRITRATAAVITKMKRFATNMAYGQETIQLAMQIYFSALAREVMWRDARHELTLGMTSLFIAIKLIECSERDVVDIRDIILYCGSQTVAQIRSCECLIFWHVLADRNSAWFSYTCNFWLTEFSSMMTVCDPEKQDRCRELMSRIIEHPDSLRHHASHLMLAAILYTYRIDDPSIIGLTAFELAPDSLAFIEHIDAARDGRALFLPSVEGCGGTHPMRRLPHPVDIRKLAPIFDNDLVGQGAYAQVYTYPDDSVIKVGQPAGSYCGLSYPELRELLAYRRTGESRHIVSLKDVQLDSSGKRVCLILARQPRDLRREMQQRYRPSGGLEPLRPLIIDNIRQCIRDLALGLAWVHAHGFLYRDLKPANVLMTATGRMQLTDFGLSRPRKADGRYTPGMQTREYSAPEVLMELRYNEMVDIWSLGCLLAYLGNDGRHLFIQRDRSHRSSQGILDLIFTHLGTPEAGEYRGSDWKSRSTPRSISKPTGDRVFISPALEDNLRGILGTDGMAFLKACLQLDPRKRLSASALLRHPFLLQAGAVPVADAAVSSSPAWMPSSGKPMSRRKRRDADAACTVQ